MQNYLNLNLRFFKNCPLCSSKHIKNIGLRYNSSQGLFPCKKGTIGISAYRCSVCDVVFANPIPINTSQFYETQSPTEYFDVILTKDDQVNRWNTIKEFVYKHINSFDKALDVGSGIGIWTQLLIQNFKEVVAVEPSKTFFKQLKENLQEHKSAKLYQSTFEEFSNSNPSDRFDFIFIHEVLEHVPNPIQLLSIAKDMLKEKGIIYVCVPNNRWLTYTLVKLAYALTGKCFTPHLAPLHPPFHLYEFSKNTFHHVAPMLNLEIIDIRTRTERTYVPRPLHYPVKFFSKLLDKGYEVEVIFQKSA